MTTDARETTHFEALFEALRFAEEYGYNRWQEARDMASDLTRVVDAARGLLALYIAEQYPPPAERLRKALEALDV